MKGLFGGQALALTLLSLSSPGLAADPFSLGELRFANFTCPTGKVCSVEFTGEAHGVLINNDEKKEAARDILSQLVELFPAIPDHSAMLTATLFLANRLGQQGEGYSGTEEGKIGATVVHVTAQHIHKAENKYCADYVYMDGNAGDKLIGTANLCLDPAQAVPIGNSMNFKR